MKKFKYLLMSLLLVLCSCENPIEEKTTYFTVRFLTNTSGNTTAISGGNIEADSLLFSSVKVNKNEKVSKPSVDPTLENYDFAGWYLERTCENKYDFNSIVTSNLTLYASYTRKINSNDDPYASYEEVEIPFKENRVNNLGSGVVIDKVMNIGVNNNSVSLSKHAINKLERNKENVSELLNYRIDKKTTDFIATYSNFKIHLSYTYNSVNSNFDINVTEKKLTITDSSTYENKALIRDSYDIKDRSIILAGSSSMENWSTSKEDLKMLTTTNIGIGGTRVEHWDNYLNERLVYPNSPKIVAYYLGINNIINNYTNGTETGNDLCTMFSNVHNVLPETKIVFVLVNLVPGYMKYKAEIEKCNEIVMDFASKNPYVITVDAGKDLLTSNNEPNWAYFLSDGLHMSLAGYVLWGQKVKETLISTDSKLGDNND